MRDTRSLRELKGIGEKTEKLFGKVGVTDLGELLRYYPREYDCYEPIRPIADLVAGSKNAVLCRIDKRPSVRSFSRTQITMVHVNDGTGSLQVNWFHMPFLRSTLKVGAVYVFRGLVIEKNGRRIMEHPQLFTPAAYEALEGELSPLYPLTAGLSHQAIRKAVQQVLAGLPEETEYLPPQIRELCGLAEINFARRQIHFPKDKEALLQARSRLAFDEFFFFLLGVARSKEQMESIENHFPMKAVWKTEEVLEELPFALTGAQRRVWEELENDLKGRRLMNRLIQGDVGSGKTILAFLAMIQTYENGYQSALMVPTEVLAAQHHQSLCKLLEENGITDAGPVLLRGSCTAKEKREIYERIRSGEAKMIIGTHALIQEAVEYRDLGLVITDEQHRFGVRQRAVLAGKGEPPNILVMSATPIPRTLAMILYGDLDLSVLDELPKNRKPIKNAVVDIGYRETAYRFIEKQVAKGRQVYVICPMVEASEEIEAENVTDYTKRLKGLWGDAIRVEMLHGRMRPAAKTEIMERFAAGEIQVLVSTTVIEVGVDVPNATVMMIENAERFGLAQLHQLRGRVGRGTEQSYCIFVHGEGGEEASERLQVLAKSNDGFFIAEEDLRLRGPGDLFGVRQSGIAVFALADIYRDAALLKQAGDAVRDLLEMDPDLSLPQHAALREELQVFLSKAEDLSG